MGWIFLEALVALALAVGIVWWTMGPKKKRPPANRTADQTADHNAGERARDVAGDKADDGAPR